MEKNLLLMDSRKLKILPIIGVGTIKVLAPLLLHWKVQKMHA